jgi:hypothetical protein
MSPKGSTPEWDFGSKYGEVVILGTKGVFLEAKLLLLCVVACGIWLGPIAENKRSNIVNSRSRRQMGCPVEPL